MKQPQPVNPADSAATLNEYWRSAEDTLRRDLGLPPLPETPQRQYRIIDRIPRYEQLKPGSANRLLTMAENEQRRRIARDRAATAERWRTLEAERASLTGRSRKNRLKLTLVFIATLAGYAGAAALLASGPPYLAIPLIIASTAIFTGLFLRQNRRRANRQPVRRRDRTTLPVAPPPSAAAFAAAPIRQEDDETRCR